ncbi:MAG: fibronectin type III domain-containing protein [Minicystis sp.]
MIDAWDFSLRAHPSQKSVDQAIWTSSAGTMQARTTITGLLPGQLLYFRFRAHTRKGLGDYSNVVKCRAP